MPDASVAPLPTAEALPEHLRLALTYVTAKKFVEEELPKVGYSIYAAVTQFGYTGDEFKEFRSKYPESLFWIAEQYGERNTGYDLAEAIKMWLRMNNAEGKSVCEVLMERGWEGVGEIDVFLSHVQAEYPYETMKAMERIDSRGQSTWGRVGPARKLKHKGSKVWVDYFCLRQLRNDFKPAQIEELIRKTGAVYVLMDGPVTGSSYPTRSFTIFELSSAVKSKATLMIETPSDGPLAPPEYCCCPCCFDPCASLDQERCACCDCCCYQGRCCSSGMPDYSIDAASATARRAEDKAMVEKFIEEGPGFARVNQVMERELRSNAVRYACNDAIGCWCCLCRKMGCVDTPAPTFWLKMGSALLFVTTGTYN